MNTLSKTMIAAALLATGGGALAYAQGAPDPGTAPEAAQSADERPVRASFRGDRDGRDDHGHRRGGGRGAMLGAFGPSGGAQLFEAVDADGDGSVTQAEIDAYLAAQVADADTDTDGALALDEFAPVFFEQMRPRMVDAFQALDADGSGEVTQDELDDRFGRVVERLDRDGDDALTLQDGRRGRN